MLNTRKKRALFADFALKTRGMRGKGRAGGDEKAAEGGAQGAAGAGKPGSGMERRTGKGAGVLCPHRPGVLGAAAAAVHRGAAGGCGDPGAVHRAHHLLHQGAGGAEHGGNLCSAGGAAAGGVTPAGRKRLGTEVRGLFVLQRRCRTLGAATRVPLKCPQVFYAAGCGRLKA
nr:MAG TPA: hypothetical protein [Caudoviricetes sp.]